MLLARFGAAAQSLLRTRAKVRRRRQGGATPLLGAGLRRLLWLDPLGGISDQ